MSKKRKRSGVRSDHDPPSKKLRKGAEAKPRPEPTKPRIKLQQQKLPEPTIPFAPTEAILLVGEGDLSFAQSLVTHHRCSDVTATVPEQDLNVLVAKYPHAGETAARLETEEGCRLIFGIDARRMGPFGRRSRKGAPRLFDRILFNFPHVGGKSTDVNRQVRYNQELLVDFFRRAMTCLAPHGSIVVTLFEGEPYTLWNIRDLGRHAGLQVERSFRFQAMAYPGYHHARTLGIVRNKAGKVGGGWRGEDRPARTHVFMRKDELPQPVLPSTKRSRAEACSEDEDG